jgi:excisionase family DNA binding protein
MPQSRIKPKQKSPKKLAVAQTRPAMTDVLTLAEAAAYLRISEDEVKNLVRYQDLPARILGEQWRFLKAAINDWLRMPMKPGSREAVMSVIGAWKDDPYLEEELKEIYRKRGRPMTEDGE